MDGLFELLADVMPFDLLLRLFGDPGASGDPFDSGPTIAELEKAIARENARRRVPQMACLELDRRAGRLSLPDFRRRYARLAGREPAGDPANVEGAFDPSTAAIKDFLVRVQAMTEADWEGAEEHLRNLLGNVVVRKAVLPRYRAALVAAAGCARLTAAAAVEEALRASIPEPRHETWRLTLAWLPLVLVSDALAAAGSIAEPLGG
ncbi:MAG TPA: hypothetical protein VE953_02985 [Terriglobales bacterium]|nr:hypothetical protein [Terriglobales bacterium]